MDSDHAAIETHQTAMVQTDRNRYAIILTAIAQLTIEKAALEMRIGKLHLQWAEDVRDGKADMDVEQWNKKRSDLHDPTR